MSMDRFAPQLAAERLEAFAAGVKARRADQPRTANPYEGNLLKSSHAHEWDDGWRWSDQNEKRLAPRRDAR
jgi:hypothetical protein